MKLKLSTHTLLITVAMLCSVAVAVAQDIGVDKDEAYKLLGYDYNDYKYYDDNEDDMQSITPLQDTLSPSLNLGNVDIRNAQYALRTYGLRLRGQPLEEESYAIGPIEIDYQSASRLMRLGLARSTTLGIATTRPSATIASTTEILLGEERGERYSGHYLRGDISGRNYLGGLSYRATWLPQRDGIRLDDAWTITHYTNLRTGRDLYIDGVYTNSAELAVEASRSARRYALSIVALLPYSNQGLRQASTAEAFRLTGNTLYNPSWGFQCGKPRNARVLSVLTPEVIARWDYRITNTTTLHLISDISYQPRSLTALNWFDASTPLPDNYRYMPSYYDTNRKIGVTKMWTTNNSDYTQIDWQGLYHTNAIQPDGHARYIVDSQRENLTRAALSLYVDGQILSVKVAAGATIDYNTTHHFKVVEDLLGADYLIDKDYYLVSDDTYGNNYQNDLHNPNRILYEGDKYSYNYRLSRLQTKVFANALWGYGLGQIGATISIATQWTHRRGYYEKEIFSGSGSYGRSQTILLSPYDISLGWRHSFGKHGLRVAAMVRGDSPQCDNMFLQTEYNNRRVEGIKLRTTLASDATYIYAPNQRFTFSATLFAAALVDDSDVIHYYDDLVGRYVDGVVSNIEYLSFGIEASANVRWSQYLSSNFLATAMRSRYIDNATVTLYADNDNSLIAHTTAEMKGHNTGTPELALYGDVEFYAAGWRARLAAYYCGYRYISPSYTRRSVRVLDIASSDEHRMLLRSQQRFDDIASMDLSVSKRIRLKWATMSIQLSIRNMLGINTISSGYEQHRVRRITHNDIASIEPFDNRLRYGYGRTYNFGIGLWF